MGIMGKEYRLHLPGKSEELEETMEMDPNPNNPHMEDVVDCDLKKTEFKTIPTR